MLVTQRFRFTVILKLVSTLASVANCLKVFGQPDASRAVGKVKIFSLSATSPQRTIFRCTVVRKRILNPDQERRWYDHYQYRY
jgi:hypothetical protein